MTQPAQPLLEAVGLVAGYLPEVDVLNGCELRLDQGEIVGIIGPNGAGKSTLVKALFGLLPVRRGRVSLRGEDITGLPAHELVGRGVSYVPQRNNVFPRLTVAEHLRMGAHLRPASVKARAESVMALFPHLADRLNQRAGLLSGGERQMVAMARALMMDPSVLLLDEPSAGLSPANQDEVFTRIEEVNRAGVAVVMVEQNARRCLQICHRGYVLDQGTNAYTGSGQSLLGDPRVVELYLGTLARA
jgi:branched-chain amino acid transport system ATP-binding protein